VGPSKRFVRASSSCAGGWACVAIDGSKFKAVNNRDKNFTSAKVERRRKQLEESISRYLSQLDTADLQDPSETLTLKKARIKEKLEKLQSEMAKLGSVRDVQQKL
jgi:hypothetical protein